MLFMYCDTYHRALFLSIMTNQLFFGSDGSHSLTLLQAYKESVLEPMLQGTDKTPALINDYKEYHTDSTVKFLVRMSEEKLAQAEAAGLHKVFKLQSSLTCNSMVRAFFPDLIVVDHFLNHYRCI